MFEEFRYVRVIKQMANYEKPLQELIEYEYLEAASDGSEAKIYPASLSLYKLDATTPELFEAELAQVLIEHSAQIVFGPEKKLEVIDVTDQVSSTNCRQTPLTTPFKFAFANSRHHDLYFQTGQEIQELQTFVAAVQSNWQARYRIASRTIMKQYIDQKIYDSRTNVWNISSQWCDAIVMLDSKASEPGKRDCIKAWKKYPKLNAGIHLQGLLVASQPP